MNQWRAEGLILTTAALPHYDMGGEAVEYLLGRERDRTVEHLEPSCPLILRGSA